MEDTTPLTLSLLSPSTNGVVDRGSETLTGDPRLDNGEPATTESMVVEKFIKSTHDTRSGAGFE